MTTERNKLETEYVLLEEASALKKIGFKDPCLFAFDSCSTQMRCCDLRTPQQKFDGVNYNNSHYTSQPSYSQTFRWFRKNHNLYVFFDIIGMGYRTFVIKSIGFREENFIQTIYDSIQKDELYNSEEEAELACLKKLIEIVKKKKDDQRRG